MGRPFLFVTPDLIRGDDEGDETLDDKRASHEGILKKHQKRT